MEIYHQIMGGPWKEAVEFRKYELVHLRHSQPVKVSQIIQKVNQCFKRLCEGRKRLVSQRRFTTSKALILYN